MPSMKITSVMYAIEVTAQDGFIGEAQVTG